MCTPCSGPSLTSGTSFFKPQSIVFVTITPADMPNVFDSRLITHSSNLAFASQLNTKTNGGFYTKSDWGAYSLSGEVFNDLFFARNDVEDDPLFAIKESNARKIIFTNTDMSGGLLYTDSPAVSGPVTTFRGDYSGNVRGVNLMDAVVFGLEWDLDAKASKWDATSYANIVSILQPIRALSHLLNSYSSTAVVCSSLTRLQIARELAKSYDAHNQYSAAANESAQKAVYGETTSKTSWDALLGKLDGTTEKKVGYLAISILFRNTTPRAKDYEFKIHIKISSHANSQNATQFLTQHPSGFTDNNNVQISGFTGF